MTTVAVRCRVCEGNSPEAPNSCGWCMAQGHEYIDRAPDGTTPTHHDTGEPVVEWIPPTLPPTPINPLVTLYRCIP